MTARRGLIATAFTSIVFLTLVGCSSTSSGSSASSAPTVTSSVAASIAAPTASSSGDPTPTVSSSGDPIPATAATDGPSWCNAYGILAERLSGASGSPERATAGLAAIEPLNELLATGVELGFISEEEKAANDRLFAAYRDVLTLASQGSTEDSEDMSAARDELSKVSAKEGAGIASANVKLRELCLGPGPTASPSSS